MISEPDPVYIYLLLGHNAPVRVAVDNLDTTIGDLKTYIRRRLIMNADEWPEQAQNTYNLELSKADNHRNLESSETWADLICEGDLYNDECINLHITLNNRKRQCFINNFLRNMTKHRLHNPNFPEPNHNYLFSWGM